MNEDTELQVGKCVLCGFKTQSRGIMLSIFKRKSASEVIRGRLEEHYETEHLEIIMEVWMNNQASEGY